jgi:hypothetical protein
LLSPPDASRRRFATSWQLAALTLCVLPPLFLLFWLFGRLSRRYIREQLAASAAAAALAEESLAGLRTVRAFAKEGAAGEAYAAAQRRTLRFGLRSAALEGFFLPLNGALATGGCGVVGGVYYALCVCVCGGGRAGGGVFRLLRVLGGLAVLCRRPAPLSLLPCAFCTGALPCRPALSSASPATASHATHPQAGPLPLPPPPHTHRQAPFPCTPPGAIMAVLWHGARQVIAGRLTAGRLSAFVVYAVYVAGNAGMLLGVMASVVQVGGGGEGGEGGCGSVVMGRRGGPKWRRPFMWLWRRLGGVRGEEGGGGGKGGARFESASMLLRSVAAATHRCQPGCPGSTE